MGATDDASQDDLVHKPRMGKGRVVFATIDAAGGEKRPAQEFWQTLDEKQQLKFRGLFDRICTHGHSHHNKEQFRKEVDKIYAFKIHQKRLYCFQEGHDWILTNGCTKKRNAADPNELKRAARIREQHLTRLKKNT